MDEEVLVFPSRLLDELGPFEGISTEIERYLPTFLHPEHLRYIPRSLAEDDPSHKQLIPYVVLRSGDEVFCYTRGKKGGEQRLHDRWSLGVGGHICREDGDEGQIAYEAGFVASWRRKSTFGRGIASGSWGWFTIRVRRSGRCMLG